MAPPRMAAADAKYAKYPTGAQLQRLIADAKAKGDSPVVMLNILKYSNEREYEVYGSKVQSCLAAVGGRILWAGSYDQTVIGSEEVLGGAHHTVALAYYPSRAAFLRMQTLPEFAAAAEHRHSGLQSQWLIATTPKVSAFGQQAHL
eukprot:TRINITY_DN1044_c0_g4_i1.p2 TRINITY_DN1044_c0_g4~~TRINITY_DN1044_c0_g4_i1.p2  ORF type:complete len:171 (+),score=81.51 TRINITY_DN1044_c0_g4_i1:77-514(+)